MFLGILFGALLVGAPVLAIHVARARPASLLGIPMRRREAPDHTRQHVAHELRLVRGGR